MESIYGAQAPYLEQVLARVMAQIAAACGEGRYEHLIGRVKEEQSMREKCRRKGLPETPRSALRALTDAIGVRVVCKFRRDVYEVVDIVRHLPGARVAVEKDYIRTAKPNGYRSYHLILEVETPFPDVDGRLPGLYVVEVQVRTIAMDTWAALEHEIRYKKDIPGAEIIVRELKRCADELAACDVSMQALRDMITLLERSEQHADPDRRG